MWLITVKNKYWTYTYDYWKEYFRIKKQESLKRQLENKIKLENFKINKKIWQ